jgi:hypothetical protein
VRSSQGIGGNPELDAEAGAAGGSQAGASSSDAAGPETSATTQNDGHNQLPPGVRQAAPARCRLWPIAATLTAPLAAPQAKLPEGWAEYQDPSTGFTYYVNLATNETTWARPHC